MAEEAALDLLRRLASDFNVRDAWKLYQIAKREFSDQPAVTVNRARDALRGDVARQVLVSKPRSLGKSAAGPNDRLQADLIDFCQDTRSTKKCLVVTDVFTRESDEGNYAVTTNEGNKFRTLEANLPQGAVHRQKRLQDRNAIAVVDRTIQTLKKELAGKVARRGGKWDDHVSATEAYNARPHEAVHGAGRRGDSAGDTLQGAPRQCREIPAQQGIDGGQAEAPPASERFQDAHERLPESSPATGPRADSKCAPQMARKPCSSTP
eukprot:s13244_g1.t1